MGAVGARGGATIVFQEFIYIKIARILLRVFYALIRLHIGKGSREYEVCNFNGKQNVNNHSTSKAPKIMPNGIMSGANKIH
mgnify:CR=1 FL=1